MLTNFKNFIKGLYSELCYSFYHWLFKYYDIIVTLFCIVGSHNF